MKETGLTQELEILLATYNGEAHVAQLLDSLLEQQDGEFHLRVRDDGSTDATKEILEDYVPRFGGRMRISSDRSPSGSAKSNFARLMRESDADYILWADQDDVWLPNKVAVTRALFARAERRLNTGTPIYVFTDAQPVDGELNPLGPSYSDFKKLDFRRITELRCCLMSAPILGCVSGINRALLDISVPVPTDEVTGHDWWCFLLAASVGNFEYTTEPTLHYRLHGQNVSSQQRNSVVSLARSRGKVDRVRRGLRLRREQAQALQARLESLDLQAHPLAATALPVVRDFVEIGTRGPLGRRFSILSGGYLYSDLNRNLALLALC